MKAHSNQQSASSHREMSMKPKATRAQIFAVMLLTLLALAIGVLIAALYGNFSMSSKNMPQTAMPGMNQSNGSMPGMNMKGTTAPAPVASLPTALMSSVSQMNGLVMPPGMIMTADTSMEAMEDMAAVDLTKIAYTAPADARGNQILEPKVEKGFKVFNLDVSLINWNILPGTQVAAYAFNRQVPGPRIQVTEGDRIRMIVKNNLPEPTTVHWHGMILPNNMDGPADVTQKPIAPGESYTYEFTVKQSGTYFYHSHKDVDRQQTLGMYGALIVEPKNKANTPAFDQDVTVQLQEWTVKQGYTFPSMPMEGLLPNFFTINGKAYPSTETVNAKVGEKIRFRFIGSNNAFIHPMHIHGGPFKIVATDGNPVPVAAQIEKDTINVAPGERYDVIWTAREKGKWLLHCHIAHHATNDNVEVQGAGGLTMLINVT
ncbi:copper oxidase [Leptolyngbya sp. FACHB-402]|jgi:FtsP/CotA-like multicopper oxidase with cupredoxin domain|nr:copper oxidase [Leptolyngbya sp. FACHB-238]MBD2397204.1 copper oxidase [Leptolyngbya sp. FACHB-239]MBD2403990.1 copper oxidase [Leptolyngbya sp. FACHB-402]